MCLARIGLKVALEEGHVRNDGLAAKECVCANWHGIVQFLPPHRMGGFLCNSFPVPTEWGDS